MVRFVWGNVCGLILLLMAFASAPAMAADGDGEAWSLLQTYTRLAGGERVATGLNEYIQPGQPTVYLSFDDGPGPRTGEVLDILREEEVVATFFVLGQQAEQYPDTVRRIVREGHAVGNHTYDHRYDELYTDFSGFWDQVARTDEILRQIAGISPRLLRAPGGTHRHFDEFYHYYMELAGFNVYDWNIDSGDARRQGVLAEEMISNVISSPLPHEAHVLLHDSAQKEETVKALPQIIKWFKQNGYQFAVLTPDVRPVQFRTGSPRYHRNVTYAQHERYVGQAVSFRAVTVADEAIAGSDGLDEAMAGGSDDQDDTMERTSVLVSSAEWNRGEFRSVHFNTGEFMWEEGQLYVSLRAWNEMNGGTIEWKEEERVAIEQYKGEQRRWWPDLQRLERRKIGASGLPERTVIHAETKFVDDRIFFPLNSLLSL